MYCRGRGSHSIFTRRLVWRLCSRRLLSAFNLFGSHRRIMSFI